MEIFKRILFGKKMEIEVPLIGKLSCRINNKHVSSVYGWKNFDSDLIPGTSIILEGNFEGPFDRHIKNCLEVTESIDNIIKSVKEKFTIDHPSYQLKSNWKDDFHLFSIDCNGQITVDLIVRIPKGGCYFVKWQEGEIKNIK